ncbi:VOC family protein [Pedococcus ginsenosidimutans]|uniref:VOC family protein n=1 Tax=Pedococcus ginsenosidimutans TaxID=490570 RepID=A0ABP8XQI5_9MICO
MKLAVVLDCLDAPALVPFWAAALGYRHVASVPGFEVLATGDERGAPTFVLQQVAEPRLGKNRMHLDVHPPLEVGVPALVATLESLGGRRLGEPVTELLDVLGIWWQTMTDPEGNELDVVADPGHPLPVA